MPSKNKQPSLKRISVWSCTGLTVVLGALVSGACNAGEDIIEASQAKGGAAGSSVNTMGGMMTGSAGTAPLPMGGSAGSVTTTAGTGGMLATGASGGAPSGGSGGGATGGGGSGGAPMENLFDAVKGWHGWRFEMPCKSQDNGDPLVPPQCPRNDICWVGTDATTPHKAEKAIVMAGDTAKVYEFELWARGVIEPKVHVGCERLTTPKEAGGIAICKGGSDSNSGFNLWSITVEDPPQLYWMNDADVDNHRTNVLDGKFKVQARGGTKVTFKFDNKNTGQINNDCPNTRKVVEGVAPYPAFYKGNFFQLDVTEGSVKLVL